MVQVETRGSLQMALGARIRPRDVREDKYAFRLTAPPLRAVDLNQPRILLKGADGTDPRAPVGYQGQIGSCAAWATASAAYTALKMAGGKPVQLHAGWLYEQVRRAEGTWPQDVGSYLATNADRAMIGVVKAMAHSYVNDAAFDYPAALDSQATEDYVLSHRPFYPNKSNPTEFLETIWSSLDRGWPVVLGGWWPGAWFQPDAEGRLTPTVTITGQEGGHAYMCYGITPGWLICRNSWDRAFSPNANLYGMQPGDMLLPWSVVNTVLFEARAISPEAVVVPKPEPPKPQPVPVKQITAQVQLWSQKENPRPGENPWDFPQLWASPEIPITKTSWPVLIVHEPGLPDRYSDFLQVDPARAREGEADV